ncbi:hypothetical protein MRBBS_2863 [Marinobacter sp. BSs20148]|nr:hypothetical protein MRBBS_2863 [Marinobacter sp. BSs20148]
MKEAASTEGTVVKLAPSRFNNSANYAPVLPFTQMNGRLIEFTSSAIRMK